MLEAELEQIIVIVENPTSIDLEQAFLADVLLIMKILHSTECAVTEILPLLKAGFVPIDECASNRGFKPVPVVGFGLFRFFIRFGLIGIGRLCFLGGGTDRETEQPRGGPNCAER